MSFGGGGFGSASPFGGASTTNNAFGGFGSNSNTPGTSLDSLILYSHRVVCVCVPYLTDSCHISRRFWRQQQQHQHHLRFWCREYNRRRHFWQWNSGFRRWLR